MNEPLKGKGLWLRDYDLKSVKENIKDTLMEGGDPEDRVFFEKEIKSAVEWLKTELNCRFEHGANWEQMSEAIDMAFEDVVKRYEKCHKE